MFCDRYIAGVHPTLQPQFGYNPPQRQGNKPLPSSYMPQRQSDQPVREQNAHNNALQIALGLHPGGNVAEQTYAPRMHQTNGASIRATSNTNIPVDKNLDHDTMVDIHERLRWEAMHKNREEQIFQAPRQTRSQLSGYRKPLPHELMRQSRPPLGNQHVISAGADQPIQPLTVEEIDYGISRDYHKEHFHWNFSCMAYVAGAAFFFNVVLGGVAVGLIGEILIILMDSVFVPGFVKFQLRTEEAALLLIENNGNTKK